MAVTICPCIKIHHQWVSTRSCRALVVLIAGLLAFYHTAVRIHLASEPHYGAVGIVYHPQSGHGAHEHSHQHDHHHHNHPHHDTQDHPDATPTPSTGTQSSEEAPGHQHAASDHLGRLYFTPAPAIPAATTVYIPTNVTFVDASVRIISAICASPLQPRAPPAF